MNLFSVGEAVERVGQVTDPKELTAIYEQFKDTPSVVKAIVNRDVCPDEIKKSYVLYALNDELKRFATTPKEKEILEALVKSLEAWHPVQKMAPVPELDFADPLAAKLFEVAQKKRAIILSGPPGTSKTFLARVVARALTKGDGSRVQLVQFHSSYSYEDFIEAIVPEPKDGAITYSVEPKVFWDFCIKAMKQPQEWFVFVIDEINRADIGKVFGEVFSALEYRGQPVKLVYSKKEAFVIPSNVIIIGTMNTMDRSIHDLDFALRRRFYFFEVPPSEAKLNEVLTEGGKKTLEESLQQAIVDAFAKIQSIYPLGHAYFKDIETPNDVRDLWVHQLKPLLDQYFEFEPSKVKDVEKLLSLVWASSGAEA